MKKSKKKQRVMAQLFTAANLLQQKSGKALNGLTLRQYMLLTSLYGLPDKKAGLSQLADAFGGTRQNAKQLADALAAKGFAEISASPADKRGVIVSLTPTAEEFLRQNEDAGEEILAPAFKGIGEKTLDGAIECLDRLIANLQNGDRQK
ncbi:MAG TPA: MarR family transcriptional regulator [Candidatus Borkfalkia stercoripullorum]|nr:MarR family transcriptional regulator [Candidatus Borkfalkia stercoripullorum]